MNTAPCGHVEAICVFTDFWTCSICDAPKETEAPIPGDFETLGALIEGVQPMKGSQPGFLQHEYVTVPDMPPDDGIVRVTLDELSRPQYLAQGKHPPTDLVAATWRAMYHPRSTESPHSPEVRRIALLRASEIKRIPGLQSTTQGFARLHFEMCSAQLHFEMCIDGHTVRLSNEDLMYPVTLLVQDRMRAKRASLLAATKYMTESGPKDTWDQFRTYHEARDKAEERFQATGSCDPLPDTPPTPYDAGPYAEARNRAQAHWHAAQKPGGAFYERGTDQEGVFKYDPDQVHTPCSWECKMCEAAQTPDAGVNARVVKGDRAVVEINLALNRPSDFVKFTHTIEDIKYEKVDLDPTTVPEFKIKGDPTMSRDEIKFTREGVDPDADFLIPQRIQARLNGPITNKEHEEDIAYFQKKLLAAIEVPEGWEAATLCEVCNFITKRDKRFLRCYSCEGL